MVNNEMIIHDLLKIAEQQSQNLNLTVTRLEKYISPLDENNKKIKEIKASTAQVWIKIKTLLADIKDAAKIN